MKVRWHNVLFCSLVVYALLMTFLFVTHRKNDNPSNKAYSLLSKRIYLEDANDILINFEPLRKDLRQYLDDTGLKYSIYFEYLFSGTSIKDSNNDALVGASLLKVPLVMDLYSLEEKGKIDLDQKIIITNQDISDDPEFGNVNNLKAGDMYSLRELAKLTLTSSDNTAALAIYNSTKNFVNDNDNVVTNLGIETNVNNSNHGNYALISAKEYSNIFKCLYFSCNLSKNHSQEILEYLTQSKDDRGLRAGTPGGYKVAHKIGSFSNLTQSDCGIIYHPNRRYLLCVMLDTDKKSAKNHIEEISRKVSSYVSNQ